MFKLQSQRPKYHTNCYLDCKIKHKTKCSLLCGWERGEYGIFGSAMTEEWLGPWLWTQAANNRAMINLIYLLNNSMQVKLVIEGWTKYGAVNV